MAIYKEIKEEADKLEEYLNYDYSELNKLVDEASKVGNAWSGSWLGYHSCVYYEDYAMFDFLYLYQPLKLEGLVAAQATIQKHPHGMG